jgi:hypothetical protein
VQRHLLGEAVGLAVLAAVLMPVRPVVPLDGRGVRGYPGTVSGFFR